MEGTAKRFRVDKLSLMLALCSLVIHTLIACDPICLLAFCCCNELCASWHQSYLGFFLQSDVHPPVAGQSPLLHGMVPEVIIISKNLHRHKGKKEWVHLLRQNSLITLHCSPRRSCAQEKMSLRGKELKSDIWTSELGDFGLYSKRVSVNILARWNVSISSFYHRRNTFILLAPITVSLIHR